MASYVYGKNLMRRNGRQPCVIEKVTEVTALRATPIYPVTIPTRNFRNSVTITYLHIYLLIYIEIIRLHIYGLVTEVTDVQNVHLSRNYF